jgi:hypothetical protein
MNKSVDWFKVRLAALSVILAILVSVKGQPFISDKSEAINVIVTVFSILAGFIVAAITLLGDPKSLPPGSWRIAELSRDKMYAKLDKHKFLFVCYLLTLLLIFLSLLLKKDFPTANRIIEHTYLFIGTIGFIFSFLLPQALMNLQRERIEHEISERRLKEGIDDNKKKQVP